LSIPIALQLYTLREEMQKDFSGTLKKVAEIGYNGVEFAGFGGMNAGELKLLLDDLGLKPAGAHINIDELRNNLDEVIYYNLEIGNKYIVCPYLEFKCKEDFLNMAIEFNKIGTKLKNAGLNLCYHNHAHEFKMFDGVYGLDILYKDTTSNTLMAEIDTYWVAYAGLNPIEYLKKYKYRTPLIHIKDMDNTEKREFTEIGNGILPIDKIINQAEINKAEWIIVEQDKCKMNPIESVTISYKNLKKMNFV